MQDVKIYTLTPSARRKSYYNKAFILELPNGVKLLKSYGTIVCGVNTRGTFFRLWDGWSATTARHVDTFKRTIEGGRGISKAEWLAMPINPRNVKAYAEFWRTPTPNYTATYY